MYCINHSDREAAGICCYSGKPFCKEEIVEIQGKLYGKEYLDLVFRDALENKTKNQVISKEESIEDDEKIIFDGSIPVQAFSFSAGIFNMFNPLNFFKSQQYKVKITNQRLVVSSGILSKNEQQLELIRIIDIKYRQNLLGKLSNTGIISVYSKDLPNNEFSFPFIKPGYYTEIIRKAILLNRKKVNIIETI